MFELARVAHDLQEVDRALNRLTERRSLLVQSQRNLVRVRDTLQWTPRRFRMLSLRPT